MNIYIYTYVEVIKLLLFYYNIHQKILQNTYSKSFITNQLETVHLH